MHKALIVAISPMMLSVQAPAVYAQIPANTLALHYIEANTPTSSTTTPSNSGEESSSDNAKPKAAQEASVATEQVNGSKSMSEELADWVQQEKSQPKRKLYRLR